MKHFILIILIVGALESVTAQETGDVWSFTPEYAVIEYDAGSIAVYPIRQIDGEYQSELPLGTPAPGNRPSGFTSGSFIERIVFEDEDFMYIETSEDRKRGVFYSIEESRSTIGFRGVPLILLSFVTEEGQRDTMVFHLVEGRLEFSQGNPPIDAPMSRYSAINRIIYSIDTSNDNTPAYSENRFDPSQ